MENTNNFTPLAIKCSCGCEYFTRRFPARGIWEETVKSNGSGIMEVVESFTDGLRHGRSPKTMICCDCGKRIANPEAKSHD